MMQRGGIVGALVEGVMANLSSVLEQARADHGNRPAVRLDGLVLSYSQIWDAAGRMTSLLSSLGIAPGDRVAVMLPNVPAFPIVFYGALGAGAVVVPMNPFALTVRPIVFPPGQDISLAIVRGPAEMRVDGARRGSAVESGDTLRCGSHARRLKVVRFSPPEAFYRRLGEKLGWGRPLVPMK